MTRTKLRNRSPELTAAAVEGMLDHLVRTGRLVSYPYLAHHVGMHPHTALLWPHLEDLARRDALAKRPMRVAVVRSAVTRRPTHQLMRTMSEASGREYDEEAVERELLLLKTGAAWTVMLDAEY